MRTFHASIALTGVIPLLFVTACGGGGDTIGAGGGDPFFPPSDAAWSVSFAPSVADPAKCAVAAHDTAMGVVTTEDPTTVLSSDTAPDVTVSCTVVSAGPGAFAVNATASQADKSLTIQIPAIPLQSTKDHPASGTVTFGSATTLGAYASPKAQPCSFYFSPSSSEDIGIGHIWISFDCVAVVDESSSSICSITQGVAKFENCSMK